MLFYGKGDILRKGGRELRVVELVLNGLNWTEEKEP